MSLTNPPKIHAFNTHRAYTAKGQRIAYAVLPGLQNVLGIVAHHVAFYDVDRMIDGELLLLGASGGEVVNSHVLAHYDLCNYTCGVREPALKAALKAAAEAL